MTNSKSCSITLFSFRTNYYAMRKNARILHQENTKEYKKKEITGYLTSKSLLLGHY